MIARTAGYWSVLISFDPKCKFSSLPASFNIIILLWSYTIFDLCFEKVGEHRSNRTDQPIEISEQTQQKQ